VVGGSGNDSFVIGSGSDSLMPAGGDGDDTFTVAYGSGNGPRIVWGGMKLAA
jgi:Ca2+-binding RTX toxin-like protein